MKKNHLLRAVVVLWAFAVLTAITLPDALAKYAASATGSSTASVARFSFEAGSVKPATATAAPFNNARGNQWQQIALNTAANFEVPLFDYEYFTPAPLFGGPMSREKTILGKNQDIVVAPGIGYLYGDSANNPNRGLQADKYHGWSFFLQFRNNSDVTVRFKVQVDAANSVTHGIPLEVHTYLGGWVNISNGSSPVLTWDDSERWNHTAHYRRPVSHVDLLWGHYKDEPGTATSLIPYRYTALDEGWMYLEPDEEYEFGFEWCWQIHDNQTRNVLDTALGELAAKYLKGGPGAPSLDDVSLKLVFALEVEQVD